MSLEKHHTSLYNIGISYEKADVNIRGQFSISKDNQVELLKNA